MKHMPEVSIIKTKHGERYLLRNVKVHKKGGKGYKKGTGNKFISKAHYNRLKKKGAKIVGTKGYKRKSRKTSKKTKKSKKMHVGQNRIKTIIKCCKDILKKKN